MVLDFSLHETAWWDLPPIYSSSRITGLLVLPLTGLGKTPLERTLVVDKNHSNCATTKWKCAMASQKAFGSSSCVAH